MSKLVIVESPSKSKTIKQYLEGDYQVLSSKGHIRDLAISGPGGLGLDIENNFKPKYSVLDDKKPVVRSLKQAADKSEAVFLATDPDREGEAISWHLQQVLELSEEERPVHRVIFHEVTKDAVKEAFENPRSIDLNLVSSQETRRILDRIIGFKLSKLLQSKIKSKSAGRVQSAALKMIVDREREVEAFEPEEYWKLTASFTGFEAELSKVDGKKPKLKDESSAEALRSSLSETFTIDAIRTRKRRKAPFNPFTTSSLQQEASNRLNLGGQRTMMLAQSLYEGIDLKDETVGLITYMRTDSTRMAASFKSAAREHIKKHYGAKYVSGSRQGRKQQAGQDAHEAIRPTSLSYTPERVRPYLKRDEYRLYKLIYARAVASQMASAQFETKTYVLLNKSAEFRAKAQRELFDGYLKVYREYQDIETSELPNKDEGDRLKAKKLEKSQHFTSPPPRFNEASLIKEMEEKGIGRPSTYSQTVSTLKKRRYVQLDKKRFLPTDQGRLTVEKLEQYFSDIVSVDYTARMERTLDEIANKGIDHTRIIADFYHNFIPLVEKANQEMEKAPPKYTGENCPKCGSPMVYRESRYGVFEACSGFPKCKYIKPDGNKKEPTKTGVTCPKCKKGEIVEREAKRGKNKGKTFYACNNFPKCRNILRGKPTGEACADCDDLLVELEDGTVVCNDKQCGETGDKT